ncbi:MAG: hypothetical protein AAB512_02445 [Patescibacteria group bacterium]
MAPQIITGDNDLTPSTNPEFKKPGEEETTASDLVMRDRGDQLTNTREVIDKIQSTVKSTEQPLIFRTYSAPYIAFYTNKLLDEIIVDLAEWQKNSTEDSLVNISNIRTILDKNSQYLEQRAENRILLAFLETIFENDNWETLKPTQIGFIKNLLNDFKNGEIQGDALKEFSRKLYSNKVNIIIESESKSKAKAA